MNNTTRTRTALALGLAAFALQTAALSTPAGPTVPAGYAISAYVTGLPGTNSPAQLAADPATHTLYFTGDDSTAAAPLYSVSPAKVVTTVSSAFIPAGYFDPYGYTDLKFSGGSLYINFGNQNTRQDDLTQINAATGTPTVLQSALAGFGNESGFTVVGSTLFFTSGNSGAGGTANSLDSFNLTTGTLTVVKSGLSPGGSPSTLDYDARTGRFFFADISTGKYYTYTPNTGVVALLATETSTMFANFALDPTGQFLYVRTAAGVDQISASTGTITPFVTGLPSPNPNLGAATDVVFASSSSGSGSSLYVGGSNAIYEVSGFAAPAPPPAIAQTYVSNTGIDAGSCSRNAPCASFAYALTETLPGGTVTAVNSGEYGPMTISRAVTVDGGGGQAAITGGAGNTAITVLAGPNDVVTLRHLALSGGGMAGTGITFSSGARLVVEGCQVDGYVGAGIDLFGTGTALIADTNISGGFYGVNAGGGGSGAVPGTTSLQHVTIAGGHYGVATFAGATDLKNSSVTGASVAALSASGGTLSASGCTLAGNATAVQAQNGGIVRLTGNDIWNNTTAISNGGIVATSGDNRRAGNTTTTSPVAASDTPNRGITVQ